MWQPEDSGGLLEELGKAAKDQLETGFIATQHGACFFFQGPEST